MWSRLATSAGPFFAFAPVNARTFPQKYTFVFTFRDCIWRRSIVWDMSSKLVRLPHGFNTTRPCTPSIRTGSSLLRA